MDNKSISEVKKNRKEAIDDLEKVMLFNTRESFLELKDTVVKQGV